MVWGKTSGSELFFFILILLKLQFKVIKFKFKFQKKDYPRESSYRIDYKDVSYAKPDVVIRRNMIGAAGGKGTKHLIGMHDIDSSKNMITM